MGKSTYVRGFVPPDETYQKMTAAWEACQVAGVPIPPEVLEFFANANDGADHPDPSGFEVEIPAYNWSRDTSTGFEVHVDEIPEKVKIIRFYNSW